ncbi:MAG TPA: hypothetical protein DHU55_11200 [Blastocatellia bacterium]|nr:hypothetical protein [Blastocatellia bacterium]HAF22871.1 hypothetical protein [Blastocatellia bacterium]HCX30316.1 hypothetical protein [Blastocatellia bacterium]
MTFTTIFLIAGIILLAIFFLIAKLAIRWAIRLTIVGAILIAVLGVAAFWWWSSSLTPRPAPKQERTAPRRRASPAVN